MSICVHPHIYTHQAISTCQSLCACGYCVHSNCDFLCACVKTYGESVCRSWAPVCLWEEGEWIGGGGEERGFRLCANRWHSTLLWLATVTQTKTSLEAHVFASERNRKLDDKTSFFFQSSGYFCLSAALSVEEWKQSERRVWLGVGVEVMPLWVDEWTVNTAGVKDSLGFNACL